MGFQLVERIKKVGHALIDLQRVSNFSSSMGLNAGTVNLQPHDQNIWKLVFEANTDLGWSNDTLDTCSSWGHHPSGHGSFDGGNLEVWEGLHDIDSKFLRGFDDFLE